MPIRSPRAIYRITGMTRNVDDEKAIIDNLPGSAVAKTTAQVYAKMKESIGDFLGLTPLLYDDEAFVGTFKPGGLNAGYKFRRNIGGFREAAYTLIAKTTFPIVEIVYNKATKTYSTVNTNFATITIGFPKGHSVTEFISFLDSTGKTELVRAIRTPKGNRINLTSNTLP